MKKHLSLVSLLSMAAAASAQSSVTLFGIVDAAVSGFYNKSDNLPSLFHDRSTIRLKQTVLRNSGYSVSRLGLRATEDLGGGLAAGFWLEAPLSNDDGANGLAFSRRSTVSLSGTFGEIRLGRDHTPTFWNNAVFDPMGQVGVGASLLNSVGLGAPGRDFKASTNYPRASNSIGYFLPPLAGVYGQFMYSFHENIKYDPGTATPPGVGAHGTINPGAVARTRAGRYAGGRIGYASGPFDVALAYGDDTTGDSYYAGSTDRTRTLSLGSTYDLGFLKLFGQLARERRGRDYADLSPSPRTPAIDLHGYLAGVTVPLGTGLVRAAYNRIDYDMNQSFVPNPRSTKWTVGYVHNLSKRTSLYATIARIRNSNGAALTLNGGPAFANAAGYVPRSSSGYDLGIRHIF